MLKWISADHRILIDEAAQSHLKRACKTLDAFIASCHLQLIYRFFEQAHFAL
jgi:hypothetical protein